MRLENPTNYILSGFETSKNKNKKYDAILQDRYNKNIKRISFGDINLGEKLFLRILLLLLLF